MVHVSEIASQIVSKLLVHCVSKKYTTTTNDNFNASYGDRLNNAAILIAKHKQSIKRYLWIWTQSIFPNLVHKIPKLYSSKFLR